MAFEKTTAMTITTRISLRENAFMTFAATQIWPIEATMHRLTQRMQNVETESRLTLIATSDKRFAAANHRHPQRAQMATKSQKPAL